MVLIGFCKDKYNLFNTQIYFSGICGVVAKPS